MWLQAACMVSEVTLHYSLLLNNSCWSTICVIENCMHGVLLHRVLILGPTKEGSYFNVFKVTILYTTALFWTTAAVAPLVWLKTACMVLAEFLECRLCNIAKYMDRIYRIGSPGINTDMQDWYFRDQHRYRYAGLVLQGSTTIPICRIVISQIWQQQQLLQYTVPSWWHTNAQIAWPLTS